MKILVLIKQVPDTTDVKIDPVTNTLKREGVESVINPFDMYAIIEVSANYPGSSENGFTAIGSSWMREDDFHYPTFAHEIGHLWWGNYIIGKGVLMSEGLAQFSYYLFMEKKYGRKKAEHYLDWGEWRYDQAKFKYFAQIEPDDPVKYDFCLSRIGIVENCDGHKAQRCQNCELLGYCRQRKDYERK